MKKYILILLILFIGCTPEPLTDIHEDDDVRSDNPDYGNDDPDRDLIITYETAGLYVHNPTIYEGYVVSYEYDVPRKSYGTGSMNLSKSRYYRLHFNGGKEATLTLTYNGSVWTQDVILEFQFFDDHGKVRYTKKITLYKSDTKRTFTIKVVE